MTEHPEEKSPMVDAALALGGVEANPEDPPVEQPYFDEPPVDLFEEAPPDDLDNPADLPIHANPGAEIVTFSPDIKTTKTALTIPEGTPFEEWEAIGGKLRQVYGAVKWWTGDWLNFGERQYGEKYAQALDATNYDYGTLRNLAWVAKRFELSRRRDNLPFSHHQEVASLDPDKADALLIQAEQENWTRAELREVAHHRKQLEAPGTIDELIKIVVAGFTAGLEAIERLDERLDVATGAEVLTIAKKAATLANRLAALDLRWERFMGKCLTAAGEM